jgi:hypothetical protein
MGEETDRQMNKLASRLAVKHIDWRSEAAGVECWQGLSAACLQVHAAKQRRLLGQLPCHKAWTVIHLADFVSYGSHLP